MNAARFATPQSSGNSSWEMPLGMVLSVILHMAIFLFAVFGLPFIVEPPPPIEEAIPVDLVPLGDKTTAPPPKSEEKPPEKPPEPPKEVKPPEPKPEPPKPEPPKEEPKPPPPPPPPTPAPPPPAPTPPPPEPKAEVPLPAPEKKPEPPKPEPPKPDQLANIKPPDKKPPPPKTDDFDSLLKTLDKMKQPQPKTDKPPDKKPPKDDLSDLEKTLQDMQKSDPSPPPSEQKVASTTATSLSDQPSASDKDYIAGQFHRCWSFDIGARDPASLIVRVHVMLQPDGSVSSSEIVPDPRYDTDPFYRAAAESARRSTRACSPIKLPPGKYDTLKDLILTFDPRDAVQ